MSAKRQHLQSVPAPWDYNPSKWSQRILVAVIASGGFFISLYLGLFQWGVVGNIWDPLFGEQSERVISSNVSHVIQRWTIVPDAILGALAYLGDIVFALAGSTRRWQYRPWLVVVFGIDVIPLGVVSIVLVILQGTVVGAWCFLCLVTALISLILIFLAYDEVWSTLLYLRRVWSRSSDRKIFWRTFWGSPSDAAYEAGQAIVGDRDVGTSH